MLLINVPYKQTFGVPDQGQTLDVKESQTAESALRDDWTRNVPQVILEHMCTGKKAHDIFNPGSRSKGLSLLMS
jgi:hypothetical protein